jgi:hypothetical protein
MENNFINKYYNRNDIDELDIKNLLELNKTIYEEFDYYIPSDNDHRIGGTC